MIHCCLQSHLAALSTAVRISPESVMPKLVDQVIETLSDPTFCTITREEYSIFCWPEGELFDKSVIEA